MEDNWLDKWKEKIEFYKLNEDLREVYTSDLKEEFEKISKAMDEDFKFKSLMETRLKDLDPKFEFSFDSRIWNAFSDFTFYDFLKRMFETFTDWHIFISENDDRPRGWMVYHYIGMYNDITDIKIGSFCIDDPKENLKFILELEDFFREQLKQCISITWRADPKNEKVFKFYNRLIKKYSGEMVHDSDGSYCTFYLYGDRYWERKKEALERHKKRLR